MRKESAAKKNITPSVVCTAPWRLVSVLPVENYCLQVEFTDGTKGLVEVKELIFGPEAGVFEALKSQDLFNQVALEYGAATWPNGLDLAPDAMYTDIKSTGVCRLK